MKISQAYEKFMTPKNLVEHMLRVAALSKIITDNWEGESVESLAIIKACAMHDISKPANFDTSIKAQEKYGMVHEDVARIEQVKNYILENFGKDEHKAAILMCNELGFGQSALHILENFEWEYMERLLAENDINSFIALYCDMRIGPKGILPLKVRFDDLIARGRGEKHSQYFPAAQKCEELIQKNITVDLQKITDLDLNEQFPEILKIEI